MTYIVVESTARGAKVLASGSSMNEVWSAFQKAVRSGKIVNVVNGWMG